MDIRKYFQDYLLLIFLISIHRGFCSFEDDYEDIPQIGRCPRIRSKLKNGRVRLRYKGRVAKFLCDSGYELAGKRSSTCVRGQWSNPTPVCVARGCNRVPSIANGRVTEMYRGALLVYDCNPGYTLSGDSSIHCDGRQWNATPPICSVNPDVRPETKCDFESAALCGWTHDPTHDFDWFRNQFATPSGHVGTGPSYDHTFGENKAGYYMYIEASSPRRINDTARLFSPVYPSQESGGCFTFWYHMYGATTGGLRVYFKPESHVFGELSPKWEKFGDQGDQWFRGNISVPAVNENFQIVIEGIRGESYVGDSAIDDVNLSTIDCQTMENENDTSSEVTAANSCRGRCRTASLPEDSCECKESCVATSTCCGDYHILCSEGNETIEPNTNEPEPGDYYGKTTSPLTVTASLSTETRAEVQNSTATSSISSQFTSQSSMSSITYSSSTITVPSVTAPTSSSTSSTSSTSITTDAEKSSTTTATVKTEPQTVADISTSRSTYTVIPVAVTSSIKPSTKVTTTTTTTPTTTTTTLSTTTEAVISASTNSVKPTSSTNTTPVTSTRSTLKTPSVLQKSSISTILMTTPLTTSTTTTQRSTSASPMTTTQSSTTTTPMSTTQSSTTSTPLTTTTTSTSSSTMPTTTSSTTLKLVPVTLIQSMSLSTLVSIPAVTSSVSQSSTVSTTTTPRYNLRPRKTTSISTSTGETQSSSTRTSPASSSTTVKTFTTEPSTVSSAMITSRTRFRFDFKFTSTSTVSSTITSPRYRTPIFISKTNNYANNEPKSTTPFLPSSTSNSYEMVASKTESSKSSGSSSIITGVVIFSIICLVGIAVFFIRRYRGKRLSKLDDDSEMRFLPDSDYMEYSDASTLERILEK